MCLLNIPDYVYVLLCCRYLFLIYLGYNLSTSPFVISSRTLLLSVLSLITLIVFSYGNLKFAPFFFNHEHFTTCHWPSYYYVSTLLLFLYVTLYNYLSQHWHFMKDHICLLGRESFNIFLLQMALFSIFDIFPLRPLCYSVCGQFVGSFCYVVLCIIICTIPVCMLNHFKK